MLASIFLIARLPCSMLDCLSQSSEWIIRIFLLILCHGCDGILVISNNAFLYVGWQNNYV